MSIAAAAAENITDHRVEALQNIVQKMEDATNRGNISNYFRWNLAFTT